MIRYDFWQCSFPCGGSVELENGSVFTIRDWLLSATEKGYEVVDLWSVPDPSGGNIVIIKLAPAEDDWSNL